jgi:SAM-dependent methyltransferase
MKESEIRPEALLRRYLELSERDAHIFFDNEVCSSIACVGCGSVNTKPDFVKHGFNYNLCLDCGTLYQTPRPSLSAFESFYRDSESSNYWGEVFFPAVAEGRREKIFRPRVERLLAICELQQVKIRRLIDVGAGYGIFLDEWRNRLPDTHMLAIEPSASLAEECRVKGFEVVENIVEQVGENYNDFADLLVCFEVLEHIHDPMAFMKSLIRLVRPDGIVFVSTLCVDGFDLQVLWDKSNQISPPHHINFLSVVGFENLFRRAGLVDVNVTTPGQLDVDIVRNAVIQNPNLISEQRFIERIIKSNSTASAFQNFLSENCLSSHAWVYGKRPE